MLHSPSSMFPFKNPQPYIPEEERHAIETCDSFLSFLLVAALMTIATQAIAAEPEPAASSRVRPRSIG